MIMDVSEIKVGHWYWVYLDGYGVVMARVAGATSGDKPSSEDHGLFEVDHIVKLNGDIIASTTRVKTRIAEVPDFVKEVKNDVLPRDE